MVNIVINGDKKKIKTSDIEKGIIISKNFYCLTCDLKMCYVKESKYEDKYGNNIIRESHFKHKNKIAEGDCKNQKYKDYTKKDIENEYNNEKSDFHKEWQDIFDTNNLEHKMVENGKLHYADIYIEQDDEIDIIINNDSIFSNYKPNKLVIEVQHSRISLEKMIERTNFYHKNELKRELIWIFDLQKKVNKMEKIITHYETKYRLKLMNQNEHDFQLLFNITDYKPIIILDNGGNILYYIKDIPKLDSDYLDVIGISRVDFLNQIGKYVNKELIYNGIIVKDTVKIIDYENAVLNLKNINEDNKNMIRYIFYIMEYISYNELKFNDNGVNLLENIYLYLKTYSKKSEKIKSLFKNYLDRNRSRYKKRLNFGKDCGKEMNEVSYNYLYWIYKDFGLEIIIKNYKEGDDIDDCLRCVNIDDWKERKIRQDVELYENINDYVKENIEYYNDLEGEDWFVIDEDDLNVYEYLEMELSLVDKRIYKNEYKNLILQMNNDVIKKNYEKQIFIKSVCNKRDNICKFCKNNGYNKYELNICDSCNSKQKDELMEMLKDENQEQFIKKREERMKLEYERRKIEEEKRKVEEEKKKVENERIKKEKEEISNKKWEEWNRYMKELKEKEELEKLEEKERYNMYKEDELEKKQLNKKKKEEEEIKRIKEEEMNFWIEKEMKRIEEEKIKKEKERLKDKIKNENECDSWIEEERRRKEEKSYKYDVIHYYQHNIMGLINPIQQRLKKCKNEEEYIDYLKSEIVYEDIKKSVIKKIEIKEFDKILYKFENVEECDEWLMSYKCVTCVLKEFA